MQRLFMSEMLWLVNKRVFSFRPRSWLSFRLWFTYQWYGRI